MYRGMGSGLIFIPMTTLSLSAVSKEEMGTASGLFNMVRTIGGSIGIAILVAMLSSHAQMHQSYLAQQVDPFRLGIWSHSFPAASGIINGFQRSGSRRALRLSRPLRTGRESFPSSGSNPC
jgi:hypothetical protein